MKYPIPLIFIFTAGFLMGQDSGLLTEAYPIKHDQIEYYNAILTKDRQMSRIDAVIGMNLSLDSQGGVTASPYGSLLFRPFKAEPVLGQQIIQDFLLYKEVSRQTGCRLSSIADQQIEKAVDRVLAYRNREWWEHLILELGANFPYDLIEESPVNMDYLAAVGYEINRDIVISLGSTLADEPRIVMTMGFSAGSNLYSMGYALFERMEKAWMTRRYYESFP